MTAPVIRAATSEDGPAILRIDRDGFSPVHSPGAPPAGSGRPAPCYGRGSTRHGAGAGDV